MRHKLMIALLLSVASSATLTADAISAASATTVTAIFPSAISMTVPASHSLDVNPGTQAVTPLSIGVVSNTTWSMSVYKSDDLNNGSEAIPSSRLVYTSNSSNGTGVSDDTEFYTSESPTTVVSSGTQTGEDGSTVIVNYKLTADYTDDPGAYSTTHTYVAAAP